MNEMGRLSYISKLIRFIFWYLFMIIIFPLIAFLCLVTLFFKLTYVSVLLVGPYVSVRNSVCLSVCVSTYLCEILSVCLSVSLTICSSYSVRLYIHLCIYLFVSYLIPTTKIYISKFAQTETCRRDLVITNLGDYQLNF
jgi:hypothetical protein